jgi:hypothetical protein
MGSRLLTKAFGLALMQMELNQEVQWEQLNQGGSR